MYRRPRHVSRGGTPQKIGWFLLSRRGFSRTDVEGDIPVDNRPVIFSGDDDAELGRQMERSLCTIVMTAVRDRDVLQPVLPGKQVDLKIVTPPHSMVSMLRRVMLYVSFFLRHRYRCKTLL